ncbi:alpha/beta-hydrolase [Dothidotthia symphoricarpi CBS 119687]|uniref:Alpha/beta-hydrolase n=1 Tax=Dothidotthia symphoricarpi CBS 119687 TaxID=1392245 RepID=A0A6A5ZZ95_9PLEO|nr:alpha/beta-hydrolase [Dothidotthia symphoricarpi CBS 119687]KAF2124214.1 alpha/beta-hydrolase [Dothidotthia symphoricarpi CBS 119687]
MTPTSTTTHLPPLPLPPGVSENYVHCPSNGLTFHILEAGYTPQRDKPLIILCHGYPELAFSWRKIMRPLAEAGYYVVAFDQRGYGRTTGWDTASFEQTDMEQFRLTNVVRDVVILVHALGYRKVKCIVGHDFGAVTSGMSALMRPDLFDSVVMMSHPFKAPATLPFNLAHGEGDIPPPPVDIQAELAKLPEPRKHYKYYNSTEPAGREWSTPVQGLKTFLRGYLHVKSANYSANNPSPLKSWTAVELAKMPHYYIMPRHKSMPEAIAAMMENEDAAATTSWMSDSDLEVYVQEWQRTTFQGALNYYRTTTDPGRMDDVALFAGKKIECSSTFISGKQDWGNYQQPGALEAFSESCADFRGCRFIEGAGHWPQQEQPEKVVEEILAFLEGLEAVR